MATFLYRLGRGSFRRWPIVMAVWLVAMFSVVAVAVTMSQPTSDEFTIPGIPSEEAGNLQQELFLGAADAFDQASVNVVVAAPEGETLADPDNSAAIDALIAELATIDQVPADVLVNPAIAGPDQTQQIADQKVEAGAPVEAADADAAAISPLSEDGRIGVMSFAFDVKTITDVEPATQEAVLDAMDIARDAGLQAEVNGQGMTSLEPPA